MRDYYRILGVRETASEEEIRARWVELSREFHPDKRRGKPSDDQRIREINEAYDTLKYSSSRIKYDLKRAYERKKRRSRVRRRIFLSSLLWIPLLLGGLYFYHQMPQIAFVSEQNTLTGGHQTNQENQRDGTVQEDRGEKADQVIINVQERTATPIPELKPKLPAESEEKISRAVSGSTSNDVSKKIKRKREGGEVSSKEMVKRAPQYAEEESLQERPKVPTPTPSHTTTAPSSQKIESVGRKGVLEKNDQREQIEQVIQKEQPVRRNAEILKEEDSKEEREPDEVRRFFSEYIRRYTEKDIDGFLLCFSRNAVQNQKDGFYRIRKIYSHFFNQSQRLNYQLKDPQIEIFQNDIRVRACYEVEQVLKAGGTVLWRGNIEWVLVKEGGELKISALQYRHDPVR